MRFSTRHGYLADTLATAVVKLLRESLAPRIFYYSFNGTLDKAFRRADALKIHLIQRAAAISTLRFATQSAKGKLLRTFV